jgi:hypothetical protein
MEAIENCPPFKIDLWRLLKSIYEGMPFKRLRLKMEAFSKADLLA